MKYPTAICKTCGNYIYDGKGVVDKKGYWNCHDCEKAKEETRE